MRLRRVLVVMGAVALSACGKKAEPPKQVAPPAPPPPPVAPAPQPAVVEKPVFAPVIATLAGSSEISVKSPVAGFLIQQNYQDDVIVKKGAVLFVINPILPASVPKSGEGKPKYQAIVSPTDGVAGRATLGTGDSVAQDTILTSVAAIDPIAAEFAIPAAYYSACKNRFTNDLNLPPEQRPNVIELFQADGSSYPQKGRLEKVVTTGSTTAGLVTVRALFANPDHTLKPGQYVRIQSLFP